SLYLNYISFAYMRQVSDNSAAILRLNSCLVAGMSQNCRRRNEFSMNQTPSLPLHLLKKNFKTHPLSLTCVRLTIKEFDKCEWVNSTNGRGEYFGGTVRSKSISTREFLASLKQIIERLH